VEALFSDCVEEVRAASANVDHDSQRRLAVGVSVECHRWTPSPTEVLTSFSDRISGLIVPARILQPRLARLPKISFFKPKDRRGLHTEPRRYYLTKVLS
jgi:hypothetical protein